MQETTPTKSAYTPNANGEVRFIVNSASEAVKKVREELGPDAKVISVQQVKGSGLSRFLATPKLEILARVQEQPEAPKLVEPSLEVPVKESVEEPSDMVSGELELTCGKFLEKAGLSPALLSRLDASEDWRKTCEMGLREGLAQAVLLLKDYLKRIECRELPAKTAFIGGPGSGKTTALCKLLARDVFINGRKPQVLRLEVDKPHMDEGLLLYCDVLGVPCVRSMEELDLESTDSIYVDIPGYALTEPTEIERVKEHLDRLEIDGRVLVMNAAYEESVLHRFMQTGRQLGANFQIMTHVDELDGVGKLWQFLYDQDRTLLFFSEGQNIAGDRIDDPFGYLLERTFPR